MACGPYEVIGQQKWRCSLFLVRGLLEGLLVGGGVVREDGKGCFRRMESGGVV